jgi:hypothetical protein
MECAMPPDWQERLAVAGDPAMSATYSGRVDNPIYEQRRAAIVGLVKVYAPGLIEWYESFAVETANGFF